MSFVEKSCVDFVVALSGKDPVPGGGGASALVGAIGCALGSMVGSLTLGKKKYADVEEDIKALMVKAEEIEKALLVLVDRDAEVFQPLAVAYGLPKTTPEEIAEKSRVMEAALKEAASVPLEIMRVCGEALELTRDFSEKGSALAISDAGCSATILKAALQSASLNVLINTKAMEDLDYAKKLNLEVESLLETYGNMGEEIFLKVKARF